MYDTGNSLELMLEQLFFTTREDLLHHLGSALHAQGHSHGVLTIAGREAPELDALLQHGAHDARTLGALFLRQVSSEVHQLLCGSASSDLAERQALEHALEAGSRRFLATLSTFLMRRLALSDTLAPVVAALMGQLVLRAGHTTLCEAWRP